jgi:hypothetical protein
MYNLHYLNMRQHILDQHHQTTISSYHKYESIVVKKIKYIIKKG